MLPEKIIDLAFLFRGKGFPAAGKFDEVAHIAPGGAHQRIHDHGSAGIPHGFYADNRLRDLIGRDLDPQRVFDAGHQPQMQHADAEPKKHGNVVKECFFPFIVFACLYALENHTVDTVAVQNDPFGYTCCSAGIHHYRRRRAVCCLRR